MAALFLMLIFIFVLFQVVRVQQDFVLRQDAYILFYAKDGTPWFSSLMEEWKIPESTLVLETSPRSVLDRVDTPCTPYPAFSDAEGSTCNETAGNSLRISVPTPVLDKAHSPCTPDPAFPNFESSTFHESAGTALGTTAPFHSGDRFDMVINESRVDGGGSSGDDCRNHGHSELEVDENFDPLTQSESSSPETHNIDGKKTSGIICMPSIIKSIVGPISSPIFLFVSLKNCIP